MSEALVDLGERGGVATHGGGIGSSEVSCGGTLGGGDAGLESGDVRSHLGGHGLRVLGHLVGVGADPAVGLLDLLGGLGLEGKKGTVLRSDGVGDHSLGTLLLMADGSTELGTSGLGMLGVPRSEGVEGSEAAVGPLHSLLQVGLSIGGGRLHSVDDLLPHLGAGSLGLKVKRVDGLSSALTESADHGADFSAEGSTGLLVDLLHLLLESDGTLLTLLHADGDGMADVTLVGLLDGLEHSTALGILHGVGSHDSGELVDLVLLLARNTDGDGVHLSETISKVGLGVAESIHGIEASTASGRGQLLVGGSLHLSVLREGGVELVGRLPEGVGVVTTVLLHLVADLADRHVERVSHALHLAESLGLVLGHEALQLLVLLNVLVVTLVAKLHHAHKLSMNVAVHLSLLELVASHSVLQSGHTGVELADLVPDSGAEVQKTDLELRTGGGHTGISLLLRIGDVLDSLGETLVLEGLVGAEGSIHTGRSSLELHVSVVAVLGHLGADLTELSSSGGSDGADLVVRHVAESLVLGGSLGRELGATLLGLLRYVGHLVVKTVHGLLEVLAGLLGVLLDLRSVGSDVLVGLLDLRVGGRRERGESTLLVEHGKLKVAGSLTLVLAHDLASLARAGNGGLVTLVLELSMGGELALDTTHVAVEGVLSGLGDERLLHRGTGSLVKRKVASHVGADGGNVRTATSRLLSDLLLDFREVLEQTHAPVGGVGDKHASLLDIHRLNGPGVTDVESSPNVLILGGQDHFRLGFAVGSDVHHRAANSQGRKENKGNTSTGILRLHFLYHSRTRLLGPA